MPFGLFLHHTPLPGFWDCLVTLVSAQVRSVEMLPAQRETSSIQCGSGTKWVVSFSPGSLRCAGGTVAEKNHVGLRNPKVLKPEQYCVLVSGMADGSPGWQEVGALWT